MRACLAILQDSFREAAASRVLWIAFAVILVFLLILAPFGLQTSPSTQIRPGEWLDVERFLQTVDDQHTKAGTPSAHLWTLLNKDQKTQLQDWSAKTRSDSNDRPRISRLQFQAADVVNGLLTRPDFYKPENWSNVSLSDDLKAADPDDLRPEKRAHRNLKRLVAAYSESISIQDDNALSLSYGTLTLFGPLRIAPSQLQQLIDEILINFLPWIVGFFGVFGSLIVTASIIPRTFEPGEISLLLSKPVLRSVLFVTKFIGGLIFTTLSATVFLLGLWLLLWMRFDLWRPNLLWCIPLYVFLFAIYFSVSALAGAIWRNPTVSLILVVVFWAIVTTSGVIHSWAENIYIRSQRIIELASAGDQVFMVDGSRNYHRWDDASSSWVPVLEDPKSKSFEQVMQRLFAPTGRARMAVTPTGDRLMSLQPEFSRSGGAARATLIAGSRADNFVREADGMTPDEAFGIFMSSSGDLIVPGLRGVYRYSGSTIPAQDFEEWLGPGAQKAIDAVWRMAGNRQSRTTARKWEPLTTTDLKSLSRTASVAFNPHDDSLVRWDNGTLSVLNRTPEGLYAMGPSKEFEKQQAIVSSGGNLIIAALKDGKVLALDRTTLNVLSESLIPEGEVPKLAECDPSGTTAAVLTHNQHLLIYDGTQKAFGTWVPLENGSTATIAFSGEGQLMVSNGRRSVSIYDTQERSRMRTLAEAEAWPYKVYDFIIRPIHTMLPKPSELDPAVRYIVTGEKSVAIGPQDGPGNAGDLNRQRVSFDLRSSIVSNLTFVGVMLLVGCLYLARRDF